MALLARSRTGRGQVVDAALYESAFSFTEPHVPAFGALGEVATRAGSRLPGHTPNNLYPAADGRHVHITAASPAIFRRLLAVMGRPELEQDPRFATAPSRSANEDALDAAISAWTQTLPAAGIEARLIAADVPAARIYSVADAFADPQYAARAMLVELPDADLGTVTVTGVVPKLSGSPGRVDWAGRRVGEDTRAVLAERAGLGEAAIEDLFARGIASEAEGT
jgi:crotonobetainyl-CoA:carnitine CoA-transferase CaiB-like acyl-CoA transferase